MQEVASFYLYLFNTGQNEIFNKSFKTLNFQVIATGFEFLVECFEEWPALSDQHILAAIIKQQFCEDKCQAL